MENDIFWSEIGSGSGEPGCTLPPKDFQEYPAVRGGTSYVTENTTMIPSLDIIIPYQQQAYAWKWLVLGAPSFLFYLKMMRQYRNFTGYQIETP